jgi:hypothetical protein
MQDRVRLEAEIDHIGVWPDRPIDPRDNGGPPNSGGPSNSGGTAGSKEGDA